MVLKLLLTLLHLFSFLGEHDLMLKFSLLAVLFVFHESDQVILLVLRRLGLLGRYDIVHKLVLPNGFLPLLEPPASFILLEFVHVGLKLVVVTHKCLLLIGSQLLLSLDFLVAQLLEVFLL